MRRKPAQLSGGQQQRVALGRALIAEAPVCLLDEPLSNLDAQLRQELRREIRALQQRLGITMIYVTHDQTEAMSMADRVILMRAGRIEQNGRPSELYEQPATLFTARFIGGAPMNFLDLDDSAQGAVIAGTGGARRLFAASGRGRVLGLRPEDVTVDGIGARGHFHATVTAVEYLGAEALITCRIGERSILARHAGRWRSARRRRSQSRLGTTRRGTFSTPQAGHASPSKPAPDCGRRNCTPSPIREAPSHE